MAPEKRLGRKLKKAEKELNLWDKCLKGKLIPKDFISLYAAERDFGLLHSDFNTEELKQIMYGLRGGQFGYFIPVQVAEAAKNRLPEKIPSDWLPEKFLIRSLERKNGGLLKGDMSRYRSSWAKFGIQEGQRGGNKTWYYPQKFLTNEVGIAVIKNRNSVRFVSPHKDSEKTMKGLAIDGPPSVPKCFQVLPGCMGDIVLDSRSSDCESNEDDELNDARLSFHENEEEIGAHGDSVK